MAATDVEAMNGASVDSCVAMGDERTPLLQSPGPKSTGRGRQYSDSDGLINETATANCAYSACNQVPDNSAENGGEIIKFEGSQHCHRDQLASIQIDYSARRKLIVASIVCLAFMIGEFVGGFLANSLAIATDAAHLLTDFASFLISLLSLLLAARPATKRMSFGWYRAEVMGALLSVLLIWVVTGVLVYMAVQRVITEDYEIDATVMLITAALSVVFNLVMGLLLHDHGHSHGGISGGHSHGGTSGGHSHGGTSGGHSHGGTSGGHSHGGTSGGHSHGGASVQQNHSHFDDHSHRHASTGSEHADRASEETHLHSDDSPDMSTDADAVHIRLTEKETSDLKVEMADKRNINVRAAFIHVIGDLVQSFGVLIAAYIIYYKPEWKLADPICTFLFSILVLCTTLTIMKDILNVLMEGAPHGVSFNEAKKSLCSIRGVREVHNLRLWSLTVNKIALSAHLALDNTVSSREILGIASQLMRDRYGIYECTIQTEDYMDEMNDCIHCRDPAD